MKSGTLDETVDTLFERVAAFFGECVGGDTFCGLEIEEVRDANGLIQGLQLVACDDKGGEPCRRLDKFELAKIVKPKALNAGLIIAN